MTDRLPKLRTQSEISGAVFVALEQIANRVMGNEKLAKRVFVEAVEMAAHDATTCLSELLPMGHEHG